MIISVGSNPVDPDSIEVSMVNDDIKVAWEVRMYINYYVVIISSLNAFL